MRYIDRCIYILLIFIFLSACGNTLTTDDQRLYQALELAGKNRIELEKVINKYSNDSSRLTAVKWLIINMPLHNTKEGDGLDAYRRYFQESANHDRNPKIIIDSLDKLYGKPVLSRLHPIYDIQTIDSAFLVSHIEAAFDARENRPWGHNVRWEDFCEFVLPYRLGDEPTSQWRSDVLDKYGSLIDSVASLPGSEQPLLAAMELYKAWIKRKNFKWTSKLPVGPRIGAEILDWKTGACRERADGMCYLLRTAGLPAALHRAPIRGDLNDSHSWGVIIDSDGSPWIPEQHSDAAYKFKVPAAKVLCETFSLNPDIISNFMRNPDAPNAFRSPFVRDETKWYLHPQHRKELKLSLNSLRNVKEGDTIYLAASSRNKWIAIGYGVAGKDSLNFGYVGDNTVCVAGLPRGDEFIPLAYPFNTTLKNDTVHFYEPGENIKVNIYSKHTLNVGDFAKRMIGGIFEVSDTPLFEHSDTLYYIQECPKRLFTTVRIDNMIPKRYFRYYGADNTYCNVGEIKVYEKFEDTIPLTGYIIGTPGSKMGDSAHEYSSAWDGDPYTSMDYHERSGGWTGIDLGKPRIVEKIVYTPRNRGNFIHSGYTYELYYYEVGVGWKFVERCKAHDDKLSITAPKGALFLIQCLDGGKDERIFEYDERKDVQIFW